MSVTKRTTFEELLARVRLALGRVRPADGPAPPRAAGGPCGAPRAPALDESVARRVGPEADLIALFAERARSAGMEVERTERSGAAAAAARILEDAGVRSAALAVEGELGADISAALERQGVTIAGAADQTLLAACYEAGAAVADAHAGIAETGTLVCLTDAVHARAHSLMPPLHLAVLRARDIVPDLLDHMRAMRARADDLPSAQILITGPSKTADIEGILITGVHGPGRVVVILVEDA